MQKQIPFATSFAINEVAKEVVQEEKQQMQQRLHNPTPFTLRGVSKTFASKKNLQSRVFVKPIQLGYLKYAIEGGVNNDRGLVPQQALKLNQYGNMTRGALRNRRERGTSTRRGGRIFTNPKRGKRKLLAIITNKRRYKKRFDFQSIAKNKARKSFGIASTRAMRKIVHSMN